MHPVPEVAEIVKHEQEWGITSDCPLSMTRISLSAATRELETTISDCSGQEMLAGATPWLAR